MLLALAATRAAAQDGDLDEAGPSERYGGEADDEDDLGERVNADRTRSQSWRTRGDDDGDDDADVEPGSQDWRVTDPSRTQRAAHAGRAVTTLAAHRGAVTTRVINEDKVPPGRPFGARAAATTLAANRGAGTTLAANRGAVTTPAANRDLASLVVDGAPLMSAVIDATLRAAGLTEDPVPGWRTRSRWSALVPAITSRVGNSESWREVTDPTVSRALSYDVRVSWRLERLIYDPNEPRFTAFDISRRRERRRLIATATHAYLAWLHARTVLANAADDREDDDTLSRDEEGLASTRAGRRILIEVHELQAELDALTDGWFSHALAAATRSR